MRVGIIYMGFLTALSVLLLLLFTSATHPDKQLVGTWEEVAWEYERVDKTSAMDSLSGKKISEQVKQLIAQDLIVHRAEKWEFLPDGSIRLMAEGMPDRQLTWRLKGRGHVLVLKYNEDMKESYNVVELSQDHLALHFYTEMQARGIAKITFKRIR